MDRRARLFGLDAPAKIAQTDSQGNDVLISREWIAIRGIVLDALDEAPAVKAKVIEALALLETQHTGGDEP
jgi:hypothetical protein